MMCVAAAERLRGRCLHLQGSLSLLAGRGGANLAGPPCAWQKGC